MTEDGDSKDDTKNIDNKYIVSNLARAHFFFERDTFVKHERNELYGWLDFVSNIGGLLGLTMGVSLLSLVEALYFLGFKWLCQGRKKRQTDVEEWLKLILSWIFRIT